MSDHIGRRGERLFAVLITAFVSEQGPIFEPVFLGEKFPAVDYMVQLYNTEGLKAFCFVQVKATMGGNVQGQNLPVALPLESVQELQSYRAPTYLVGVDVATDTGYIVAVTDSMERGMSSMAKTFELNRANLLHLWREVDAYWRGHSRSFSASFFDTSHGGEQ